MNSNIDDNGLANCSELEMFNRKQIAKLTADRKVPDFKPGDTLKVIVRIVEGDKKRFQAFEGMCIARKNRSIGSSVTVRKISNSKGVERVFPLYSPNIEIEVVRRGVVRRAKLYYLRGRLGKSARIAELNTYATAASATKSDTCGSCDELVADESADDNQ